MMFMDTERENRIKLGKDWPFKTLNEGECLASTYFEKEYHVSKGEIIKSNYIAKDPGVTNSARDCKIRFA